jgi:hypothetical protein
MLQRHTHECRGPLEHLLKDWPKLLEEYGIIRTLAEKVNIVSQLGCEVELLLGIYIEVSHVLLDIPLNELNTAANTMWLPT